MSPTYINAARGCGFTLTDKGREALSTLETCDCEYGWQFALLVCRFCGTGVGVGPMSDYAGRTPAKGRQA